MEKLLSQEEIKEISKAAVKFPVFDRPVMFIGPKNHKTLIGKSPKKGLIMIEGNDDTGFCHIQKRHAYKYEYKVWKNDNHHQLDFPTVFPEKELLFLNWHKITDAIYNKENFQNNNVSERFDLFIGDYEYDKKKYKCALLLYRNTKIVHTLYLKLNKKIFNKKKPSGFHFIKGKMECSLDFGNEKEILKIPYLDSCDETKYLVEVKWNMKTFIEEWRIIIYRSDKNFVYLWRRGRIPVSLEKRLQYLTVFGLDDVEKQIGIINKMSSEEIESKCNS